MIKVLVALSCALLGFASAATAKVQHLGANGFVVSHEATVPLTPSKAYEAFLKIGTWWGKNHTFSGDPMNITIDVRPGGCWCETLSQGGFVKHMEVASAAPGERLVFHGGLGPLHFMGVAGAMTVRFAAVDGGTKVSMSYQVSGFEPEGFQKLGPAVDGVLAEQLANFATIAAK